MLKQGNMEDVSIEASLNSVLGTSLWSLSSSVTATNSSAESIANCRNGPDSQTVPLVGWEKWRREGRWQRDPAQDPCSWNQKVWDAHVVRPVWWRSAS